MPDRKILVAEGLTKRFGAVTVVDDVSFSVAAGEVLGILGPNGAGKTTLFNLISGDLAANGGELSLDGSRLSAEPPYRRCQRGIGRTYQVPQPFGAMTAFENLLVPAMMSAHLRETEAYDHCAQVLRDCGLWDHANTPAGSLTLLNRKRLELARALAGKPKLLLLDEIAGGLTDAEGAELVALIRRVRDQGVTIIWIEHVLHALMAVADRILVLNFGAKIAEGAPDEVMQNPEVQRVYMGIEA
ncbi:ABC transporter ATP-binding protein [Donghicola tyrosinivorans]|jgi:branched-chain amino acid transport system ATP-binding protein|uniref:Branched-chain amino acid transport system ATP-binding protein n=1 Tax=Donghicola tyrosinivorans TaxID=1652492 RepID=A0A2T0WWE7_9RHOB|nr:ABC transporter ATP-binding protein [Donghicola tyrosinivorans]PRY91011.1 branched-chain amino acid transport system ATP-binding protein [Donghicola tyrosinivorans]